MGDRAGITATLPLFHSLLKSLRERSSLSAAGMHVQSPVQPVTDAEPQCDPRDETTRMRLLEAVLVLVLVPSSEEGDQLGKSIFLDFAEVALASGRLQRQLGLIQAG